MSLELLHMAKKNAPFMIIASDEDDRSSLQTLWVSKASDRKSVRIQSTRSSDESIDDVIPITPKIKHLPARFTRYDVDRIDNFSTQLRSRITEVNEKYLTNVKEAKKKRAKNKRLCDRDGMTNAFANFVQLFSKKKIQGETE